MKEHRVRSKSLGLGAGGSKAELSKRMTAHLAAAAATLDETSEHEKSEPDDLSDCVVASRVEHGDDEEMRVDATALLRAERQRGADVERLDDGQVAVGNQRDMDLAKMESQLAAVEIRLARNETKAGTKANDAMTKARLAVTKAQVRVIEAKIASLEARASQSLANKKLVRGRFISTFKRDVLGTANDADRDLIRDGNMFAHHGDAIVDGELYDGPGARRDTGAYIKLYGVHPNWAKNLGEFFAIHQS